MEIITAGSVAAPTAIKGIASPAMLSYTTTADSPGRLRIVDLRFESAGPAEDQGNGPRQRPRGQRGAGQPVAVQIENIGEGAGDRRRGINAVARHRNQAAIVRQHHAIREKAVVVHRAGCDCQRRVGGGVDGVRVGTAIAGGHHYDHAQRIGHIQKLGFGIGIQVESQPAQAQVDDVHAVVDSVVNGQHDDVVGSGAVVARAFRTPCNCPARPAAPRR